MAVRTSGKWKQMCGNSFLSRVRVRVYAFRISGVILVRVPFVCTHTCDSKCCRTGTSTSLDQIQVVDCGTTTTKHISLATSTLLS